MSRGGPLLVGAAILLTPLLAPGAGGRTPHRVLVEIRGMAFHPDVVRVAAGDTVVWINRDIVPHTATAAGVTAWDTGILGPGDSGRVVPSGAGSLGYVCALHPTMTGTVDVVAVGPDTSAGY